MQVRYICKWCDEEIAAIDAVGDDDARLGFDQLTVTERDRTLTLGGDGIVVNTWCDRCFAGHSTQAALDRIH